MTTVADWNPCTSCRCSYICLVSCCVDHDETCVPGKLCCQICPEQWHPDHPEGIDCVAPAVSH